ncbi:MAG: hypothetical protein O3A00_15120 [Planctomycetota bacterium]|nr:hypothetical protein [Planctomycetota bacterium]
MIQINIGDHVSSEAGYVTVPNSFRDMTRWARTKALSIAKNMPSADVYFRALPNGHSLTTLLADRSIWINYGPSLTVLGETNFAGGKEIAIAPSSYRIGRWTVLATLIHELAHVDGVRGSVSPRAAEDALLACGLGKRSEQTTGVDDPSTPYDPSIRG